MFKPLSKHVRIRVVDVCREMADAKSVKVGAKVEVVGKGVIGTVAYIGTTLFSSGKYTAVYPRGL